MLSVVSPIRENLVALLAIRTGSFIRAKRSVIRDKAFLIFVAHCGKTYKLPCYFEILIQVRRRQFEQIEYCIN